MKGQTGKYGKREKKYDADMKDLVEYVKWLTNDLGKLRDRVKIAEKVIGDLRRSGKESVESLLNTLYDYKRKQESLMEEAESQRQQIQECEDEIAMLEAVIREKKKEIERQTGDKLSVIENQEEEINQKNALIRRQKEELIMLQALNEQNQKNLTQANNALNKKANDSKDLRIKLNEEERMTEQLKNRAEHLNELTGKYSKEFGSLKKSQKELDVLGSNKKKAPARSHLALFSVDPQ